MRGAGEQVTLRLFQSTAACIEEDSQGVGAGSADGDDGYVQLSVSVEVA